MMLVAESGSTTVWVGERGSGITPTVEPWILVLPTGGGPGTVGEQPVEPTEGCARAMYAMRFPGEDVTGMTMQQLRGREGARVRKAYRVEADRAGVEWRRREYDPDGIQRSGHTEPGAVRGDGVPVWGGSCRGRGSRGRVGTGFVHTGNARSFVLDVADLYKMEFAVPVAFSVAATHPPDGVTGETRRRMRDAIATGRLQERCARRQGAPSR